jgi:hypothetical protein
MISKQLNSYDFTITVQNHAKIVIQTMSVEMKRDLLNHTEVR